MLEVEGLAKSYDTPRGPLPILEGVSVLAAPGRVAVRHGPLGQRQEHAPPRPGRARAAPASGRVTLDGRSPFALAEAELAAFRNRAVGFVFQDHHLLPQCSVLENVLVPTLVLARRHGRDHEARARELLDRVGLGERLDHRPAELSGGRAAARGARAGPRPLAPAPAVRRAHGQPRRGFGRDGGRPALRPPRAASTPCSCVVTHSAALAERFPDRRRLAAGRLEPA